MQRLFSFFLLLSVVMHFAIAGLFWLDGVLVGLDHYVYLRSGL